MATAALLDFLHQDGSQLTIIVRTATKISEQNVVNIVFLFGKFLNSRFLQNLNILYKT